MKITDVLADNLTIPYPGEVRPAWQPGLVVRSHNYTLIRVRTDAGLTGVGGTSGHHAATVLTQVKPYLLGESPFATERLARVYRHAGSGIWCLDMALWDIIGKAANLPLYQLWGHCREKVPAYASMVETGMPESRARLVARYREQGFRATKLRIHAETMKEDLALVDACREAAGENMAIMVDANQATNLPSPERGVVWDYQRALDTARELAARGVQWLEEPLSRYDFDNLIRLREATTGVPIAGGEKNMGLHEFRWLIERGVYDIIQPCPALSEGVSQLRKIAALTEMHKLQCTPHHGMGGIGLAAGVHLACTIPGPAWAEVMYEPETRTVESYQQLGGILASRIWIDAEGYVSPPEGPGLGVVVEEGMIGKYAA